MNKQTHHTCSLNAHSQMKNGGPSVLKTTSNGWKGDKIRYVSGLTIFQKRQHAASTSKVCASAMPLLFTLGNRELEGWGCHQWHNVHIKFH
jgi:hypothetical protein